MKQRRRSRLRSCRAESCAGALDAAGGVTSPRRRRGSAPQVLSRPTLHSPTDHRLERLETFMTWPYARVERHSTSDSDVLALCYYHVITVGRFVVAPL